VGVKVCQPSFGFSRPFRYLTLFRVCELFYGALGGIDPPGRIFAVVHASSPARACCNVHTVLRKHPSCRPLVAACDCNLVVICGWENLRNTLMQHGVLSPQLGEKCLAINRRARTLTLPVLVRIQVPSHRRSQPSSVAAKQLASKIEPAAQNERPETVTVFASRAADDRGLRHAKKCRVQSA
jgi:hypothetical protein